MNRIVSAHDRVRKWFAFLPAIVCIVCTAPLAPGDEQEALTVAVTYDESITDSFTGRVYLMTSRRGGEPRRGSFWFNPQPIFAMDVENWKPGTAIEFDDEAIAFPHPLSQLETGSWTFQAVMRLNRTSPKIGRGAGNAYSNAVEHNVSKDGGGGIGLMIAKTVDERPFHETERIRLVEHRSALLSDFHDREVTLRAAVILPKGYDAQSDAEYPAYYWINGFGGDHHFAQFLHRRWDSTGYEDRIVRIVPDPLCYGGHHVFADSANNGPYGTAFVEEFIPYLEKQFNLVSAPTARFLGGHSSGGWSSLWLQIQHPEFFGGTWSTAPDPVDFRAFQTVNIYRSGANLYYDEDGDRRPLAHRNEQVLIWAEDFAELEEVIGEGGQLRSFEWVFSPQGDNGLPKELFDRETGAIDPEVAEAWKDYDINLVLKNNWETLGPKLEGKLHVIGGGADTFYLDRAQRLLKETLNELGSDAVVEIIPGEDHGSFLGRALFERIDREMWNAFKADHPKHAEAITEE